MKTVYLIKLFHNQRRNIISPNKYIELNAALNF